MLVGIPRIRTSDRALQPVQLIQHRDPLPTKPRQHERNSSRDDKTPAGRVVRRGGSGNGIHRMTSDVETYRSNMGIGPFAAPQGPADQRPGEDR